MNAGGLVSDFRHRSQPPGFTASELFARGLYPFRLHAHDPEDPKAFKRPCRMGWQAQAEGVTSSELFYLDRARCNLGLHLGPSGLVVVDTDTAEGEAWAAEHLPASIWTVKTSQGRHRYYRLTHYQEPPRNTVKPRPGIDLRAAGGYVLAPGSWHFAAGVRYEPEGDWSAPITSLPVFNPAWFPAPAPAGRSSQPRMTIPVDHASVLRRAEAYLATCPPGIQGQNGSGTTFRAALKVATYFDLTQDELLDLLERAYNPRCVPPWSPAELEHKAADAWERSQASPKIGIALQVQPCRWMPPPKRRQA